ncbi:hypothetical protein BJY59DRAFT_380419 [Rhodotorula toruloides]
MVHGGKVSFSRLPSRPSSRSPDPVCVPGDCPASRVVDEEAGLGPGLLTSAVTAERSLPARDESPAGETTPVISLHQGQARSSATAPEACTTASDRARASRTPCKMRPWPLLVELASQYRAWASGRCATSIADIEARANIARELWEEGDRGLPAAQLLASRACASRQNDQRRI